MRKHSPTETGKRTPTSVRLSADTRAKIAALQIHLLHCTAAYAIAWAIEQMHAQVTRQARERESQLAASRRK